MSTQNMDSNPQAAFPSLCSNGCGFFSTTDKEGLCSVCFKEKLKKEAESQPQGPPTTSSSTQTPPPPPPPSERPSGSSSPSVTSQPPQASTSTSNTTADLKETTLSESVGETSNIVNSEDLATASEAAEISPRKTPHPADEEPGVPAKKAKKNRCLSCKKKLGLTGMKNTRGDTLTLIVDGISIFRFHLSVWGTVLLDPPV